MWTVWPMGTNVSEFVSETSAGLIDSIVTSFFSVMQDALTSTRDDQRALQQTFLSQLSALQASLSSFNQSTTFNAQFVTLVA